MGNNLASELKRLDKKLAKLGKAARGAAVLNTLVRAGRLVQRAAKANAARDTGAMASNIHIVKTRANVQRPSVWVQTGTREQMGISADAEWYYPAIIEYGGVRKDGRAIPAKPFLRPAYDSNRGAALEIIKRNMGREIRKAVS